MSNIDTTSKSCYDSIDELPVWNWDKVINTGDLKWLVKGKGKVSDRVLSDSWDGIQQQLLDHYGYEFEHENYLQLMKRKAIKELEYLETKNKFLLNEIKRLEADIKGLTPEDGARVNIMGIMLQIGKYLGFKVDAKTFTVREYKEVLNEIKKQSRNGKETKGY